MHNTQVTSKQVAARAGVSQSAVSRVFTPGASASRQTREKVLRAAAELGYRPNRVARAMITGRSRIIGIVVAYFDNQFYPDAIQRLSVALQEQNYHALVFMATPTIGDIEDVMKEVIDYQVDGIILASVSMSSQLAQRCADHGIPVVLFNREQEADRLCSVVTDNYRGGQVAAQHLLGCGYRRIGYVAGFEGASTQRQREAGFLNALDEAGTALVAREVGGFEYALSRTAALEMFAGPDRPEAAFVANDHMAFAVMDALRYKLGLSIPGDVGIVGFDDVSIAAWPAYDLTSYRQPINRMVERTVSSMMARIENNDIPPERIVIDGELIVRGTTRAVAET
ncbi:LacI family DNA-binding transcriptional regulator [Ponticoccus sp. SC2-23]|uniref:LacI family DNA-binding transcriptional regulator n=1 Tax=Alexandriicola marinus TaxID=2081710 RepID=UPI000FD747D5|nr:LacI family DNA-binding transcriptional regulator [Alexandriicola marinus]MBM1219765.1 LacI family DNA-binding transcriptional regulator [Ponticoccus sp. SC6-9]MBM1223163.1 LacI family DNA-binding transcriptional regulator [Ponticoccus sp. SC6-15]MBM1229578.1 LacI family DNA-binding transcriptional regulator [Ponticoccus sp. SC6-38]MBM1232129.1 LacI family DNA-binding transcriptional regulator [Ponticoccus sp. SC6-45]MBM1237921.1 LacI family DNA-binding transcriptional regulator [Ponticoccu